MILRTFYCCFDVAVGEDVVEGEIIDQDEDQGCCLGDDGWDMPQGGKAKLDEEGQ